MTSRPEEQPSESPVSVEGAVRRVAVVVNGRAKSVTDELISTLDRILEGADLFVSRSMEDAREIARTLVLRGYDTVLTGGGDGTFTVTVTEVVREARRRGARLPRFGLLKLGTGNALAWVVGARDIEGRELGADIRRLIDEAGSRPVRLVEAEDIISPFCGLGADAQVLFDYQELRGKLARTPFGRAGTGVPGYLMAGITRTLPALLFSKTTHCRVENIGGQAVRLGTRGSVTGRPIAQGEVLYEGPMRICALSTIPYYGFGFRMFPYAEERPDRMQLRVSTITPFEFMRHLKEFWSGDYDNPRVLFDYLVEAVSIELDPPAAFQIGGDSRGERSRIEVRLSPTPIELVDFYAPPRPVAR